LLGAQLNEKLNASTTDTNIPIPHNGQENIEPNVQQNDDLD